MSTAIRVWGLFLAHERLDPKSLTPDDTERVLALATELATRHPEPHPYRTYRDRCECRAQVCEAALALGIDLTAMLSARGKRCLGRGLLDAWNAAYATRFGGVVGTAGWYEAKRRGVKTRLAGRRTA